MEAIVLSDYCVCSNEILFWIALKKWFYQEEHSMNIWIYSNIRQCYFLKAPWTRDTSPTTPSLATLSIVRCWTGDPISSRSFQDHGNSLAQMIHEKSLKTKLVCCLPWGGSSWRACRGWWPCGGRGGSWGIDPAAIGRGDAGPWRWPCS